MCIPDAFVPIAIGHKAHADSSIASDTKGGCLFYGAPSYILQCQDIEGYDWVSILIYSRGLSQEYKQLEGESVTGKERLQVWIDYRHGHVNCICLRSNKGCNRKCEPDTVERDRFKDWEQTYRRNIYGK